MICCGLIVTYFLISELQVVHAVSSVKPCSHGERETVDSRDRQCRRYLSEMMMIFSLNALLYDPAQHHRVVLKHARWRHGARLN